MTRILASLFLVSSLSGCIVGTAVGVATDIVVGTADIATDVVVSTVDITTDVVGLAIPGGGDDDDK